MKCILLLFCLLPACSASMIQRPGEISKYAPVNEVQGVGVVKWVNTGLQVLRDQRKQDAYRQMFDACKGKYAIVKEEERCEGVYGDPGYETPWMVVYVSFQCVRG